MANFVTVLFTVLFIFGTFATMTAKAAEAFEGVAGTNNVSSHVLDIAVGSPAQGINCSAYKWKNSGGGRWELWGETTTNAQGRIPIVHPDQPLSTGLFKLHFHTGDYFRQQNRPTFFPYIEVVFQIDDPNVHYHVPILLSNYGYSTYKGQ